MREIGRHQALTILQTRSSRWFLFGLWVMGSLMVFRGPLGKAIHFAAQNGDASHILLIPFVSAGLICLERRAIFQSVSYCFSGATFLGLVAGAIAAAPILWHAPRSPSQQLSAFILVLVLFWMTGFLLFFGKAAAHSATFPLLLLLLTVPLPDFLLHPAIYFLQKGSAGMVELLFEITRIPYLREGFIFHLGPFSIEIAEECSGIRSSMAVLILALLAAHFYIRSSWKRLLFLLASFVIMIVKNGIRIATLSILALYVDPSFLFGRLHHEGGFVFFLVGLVLLFPVLWLLMGSESSDKSVIKSRDEARLKI